MLEICSITPVLNAHFWNWRRHNFQWHNRASASPHWQDGQLCIDFSIWQPYCAGHISFDSSGTVTVASGAPRAPYHEGISPHAARRSGRLRRVRHGFALRAMSLRDGIPLPYGNSLHRIMLSFVKLSVASTVENKHENMEWQGMPITILDKPAVILPNYCCARRTWRVPHRPCG